MPKTNVASQYREILRERHYPVESATRREIVAQQYDYQLYPGRLNKLLAKTGAEKLKIIPIGDFDKAGDYWVIPFESVKDWLVSENLTRGIGRTGKRRVQRWHFHMEHHLFVLFLGGRIRLGEIDMREFYGAKLPLPNSN